ncbi:MAG: YcgL domain-containing protein [Methylococcales bacterium]
MPCYVYKSLKKHLLYLYISQKDDFSRVPTELLQTFGTLEFVLELELTPERKLAKEDSQKVLASLQEQGFFVQLPPTDFIG